MIGRGDNVVRRQRQQERTEVDIGRDQAPGQPRERGIARGVDAGRALGAGQVFTVLQPGRVGDAGRAERSARSV